MVYLGTQLSEDLQVNQEEYTATAGQTTFAIEYVDGKVDVYLNGLHLDSDDFTATSGTAIVLTSGANAGDIVSLTGFSGAGIVATTNAPTLSGPSTEIEGRDITVTITDWNANITYKGKVSGGSAFILGDTITWTLPTVSADEYATLNLTAQASGQNASVPAIFTILVDNYATQADTTILYKNSTMSSEIASSTNIDSSGNTLLATADAGTVTFNTIQQDGGQGNFTNATPTMVSTPVAYTISGTPTNTSVTVESTTGVVGTILLNDGTGLDLVEYSTSLKVTDNGDDTHTIDITAAGLTSAPTMVLQNVAGIETSIDDGSVSLEARTTQSHTADEYTHYIASDEWSITPYTGVGGITTLTLDGNVQNVDFVWVKALSDTEGHIISDRLRGTDGTGFYSIQWNNQNGHAVSYTSGYVSEMNSDGTITIVDGSYSSDWINSNGTEYVAYCASLPNDIVDNNDGVVTSQGIYNDFMSIHTWTNNGSAGSAVGHGLGVAPDLVIEKEIGGYGQWYVYTNIIDGSLDYMKMHLSDAAVDSGYPDITSSTFPTMSAGSGASMGAWCFRNAEGKCKVATYTGTAAASNVVDCGFEPQFVIIKRTDTANNWVFLDNARVSSTETYALYNRRDLESATDSEVDFTSTGFTVNATADTDTNASGGTYLYVAISAGVNYDISEITTVFDTDTREGEYVTVKADVPYTDGEVTEISVAIDERID